MVPDNLALPANFRDRFTRLRTQATDVRDRLAAHPLAVTAVLAIALQTYAAYRVYAPLPPGTWPVLKDSVIFEYIGWYLSTGQRLYIDIWEVKPPLAFELTALFALLSGGSAAVHHTLNLAATSGAIVAGAVAAAGIVHELTDDAAGAVVAGVAVFSMPYYYWRALVGFKSKYFVVAAGLACLYLALRDRPGASGVAGAAAVGFWQLAAVFPLGALGLAWQAGGREDAKRFLLGAVATGLVVLLPVVWWGAVPAMIVEVLFTPLLVTEGHTFTDRVQFVIRLLGKTLPVVLIGLAGFADSVAPERIRREWPLVLAVGWFTAQMVLLDFDSYPDLFPWFAVVGVGVGLAVGRGRASGAKRALALGVLGLVLLSVVTLGGYGTGRTGLTSPDTYDTGTVVDPEMDANGYNITERQYLYWNRVPVSTCRAFGGYTQFRLVRAMGLSDEPGPWYEVPCGRFDPAWDAVTQKFF